MHIESTGTAATANSSQVVFLSLMFDETMQMLQDAHDYFSVYGPREQGNASPLERLVYSAEMSRITLRLSSVMAWLMGRRAEIAGQITREEALAQFRLSFNEICLKQLSEMHHVLPSYMCELLTRSFSLYRRAARLDDMLGGDDIEAAAPTIH